MKDIVFIADVDEDGKLHFRDRPAFDRLAKRLKGEAVEFTIWKQENKRTSKQNGWYWKCLIPHLAEHLGMDRKALHESLKAHFLTEEQMGGLKIIRRTATLTTTEYSRYMEDTQRLACELGIDIPLPSERQEGK